MGAVLAWEVEIDTLLLGIVQLLIAAVVQLLAPNDFQVQAQVLPISLYLGWAYFALMANAMIKRDKPASSGHRSAPAPCEAK